MQKEPDWASLAAAVRAARGLRSQKAISAAGGPSDTTLSKIEANEWRPTRAVDETLAKLDQGFGWPPGTAADILAGNPPAKEALTIVSPPTMKNRRLREAEQAARHIPDFSLLAATLSLETDDLRWSADRVDTHIDPEDPDEVENLISDVESLVSDVEDFADTVDEIVKKMVPPGRLQHLRNETRRLRKQHARQTMLDGLMVTPSIGMEAAAVPQGASSKANGDQKTDDPAKDSQPDGTVPESDTNEQDRRLPSVTNPQRDRDAVDADVHVSSSETDSSTTELGDRVPRGFLADQVDASTIDESTDVDQPHGADRH